MKKAEVKSKNRYLIAVNLFLIAVLAVVAVYAWFASNAVNRVDTYDVQVHADNTLELSFDGKSNWSETLNLADLKSTDSSTSVLDSMKFIAVTGDGNNFYIPELEQKENYAAVKTDSSNWATAVKNRDYLKFTVYMRSKDPINVYLSSDSYARPSSSVVKGEDCGNPSSYATGENTFSKDCIVGALRVAGFDDKNNKKFVWITNPEYHLNNTVGSSDYSMDTTTAGNTYTNGNGTAGSEFQWNIPDEHKYYEYDGTTGTLTKETNVIKNLSESGYETVMQAPTQTTTLMATLNGSKDADGYFHSQAEFVVWIEGCDTEARRALIDGKFNLSLIFDSFSAEAYNQNATTPEDVMNGVGDEFD